MPTSDPAVLPVTLENTAQKKFTPPRISRYARVCIVRGNEAGGPFSAHPAGCSKRVESEAQAKFKDEAYFPIREGLNCARQRSWRTFFSPPGRLLKKGGERGASKIQGRSVFPDTRGFELREATKLADLFQQPVRSPRAISSIPAATPRHPAQCQGLTGSSSTRAHRSTALTGRIPVNTAADEAGT